MRPGSPKIMAGDNEMSISMDGENSPEIQRVLIVERSGVGVRLPVRSPAHTAIPNQNMNPNSMNPPSSA